jgi:PAS domain S-box-containing protein
MGASGLSPLVLPEKYLQLLLDTSPDAVLLSGSKGRIRQVNNRLEEMFGYSSGELVGKKVEILMPPRFRSAHRNLRSNYFALPRMRAMDENRELWGRRRDRTEFPVSISISPIYTDEGTLAILAIRDITEHKRTEAALRQSEERFRIALSNMPVVVFNQDRHLLYSWIYSSMPAWLGQEYIGHTDAEIFERREASRLASVKRRVLRSGEGARDETHVNLLGKKHYLDVMLEPLRGRRQCVVGIRGAYFDVTALKNYALERERLAAQLQRALEDVKMLRGLVSICASCKRIFNEAGAWQQMESYIQSHSEMKFTHGMCPDCMRKLYPSYCSR